MSDINISFGSQSNLVDVNFSTSSPTPLSLAPIIVGASGPQGEQGEDGREVSIRVSGGYIQWQYSGDASWTNLTALSELKGDKGDAGATGATGSTGSQGPAGVDGRDIALRVDSDYIQWKYSSTESWTNLVALSTLQGPAGQSGSSGSDGADGAAATISIGTVTTGAPGSSASVVNVGTESAAVLNFTIPAGQDGAGGGEAGEGVPTGGTANQVLQKIDGVNYNTQWHTLVKSDVGLENVVNADTTTTANISDSPNKRFVSDAQLTVIGNTSGVNSGDETASGIRTKLGITTLSGSNTGDETVDTIKTKLGISTLSGSNTGDESTASIKAKLGVATSTSDGYATAAQITKLDGIATGAEVNVNADWNAVSGDAQILNKPTLGTASAKDTPTAGNATSTQVVLGSDTRLTDSRTPTTHYHDESDITNLTTDLAAKVTANGAITGATKTKITYDSKGLVTAGADATTADIADSTNKRYVTDAQLTVIGNTSGTNTGDETASGIRIKLGITTLSGSNTGDETTATIKSKLGAATSASDGYATSVQITKLDGIAAGAEVNVNADWNAVSGNAQILNKPTLGSLAALSSVTESNLSFSDNTTGNASTSNHGLLLKLTGSTSNFLRADGTWAAPPSGGAVAASSVTTSDSSNVQAKLDALATANGDIASALAAILGV